MVIICLAICPHPPTPYLSALDMSYPVQYQNMSPAPPESISKTGPVYTILIIGLVFFMASNVMPSLLPDPSKIG